MQGYCRILRHEVINKTEPFSSDDVLELWFGTTEKDQLYYLIHLEHELRILERQLQLWYKPKHNTLYIPALRKRRVPTEPTLCIVNGKRFFI